MTHAVSSCLVSPREIHVAHKAVIQTVKSLRAEFPKISSDAMTKHIAGAVAAMFMERIERLEKRIIELEERPTMTYLGVYEKARQYSKGNFTTHEGSLWCCRADVTRSQPGTDSDWQLAAKRGTNGKDARR